MAPAVVAELRAIEHDMLAFHRLLTQDIRSHAVRTAATIQLENLRERRTGILAAIAAAL